MVARFGPIDRRRVQRLAGLVVLLGAFAWALPRFAGYGAVADQLRAIDATIVPVLIVVAAANLVAPSLVQVAALPGLTLRHAVVVDWVTTTVTNVVPGGSAVAVGMTWSMYRSLRLAGEAIARSIVVTGIGDALVKLGTPLPAVVWLLVVPSGATGPASTTVSGAVLVQAALVAAALFVAAVGLAAAVLAGPGAAGFIGRAVDRLPILDAGWPDRLERLRRDTVGLLAERGLALVAWTVAGHANLYLLLVVCLRAVGADRSVLGWGAILAAFAFGRLVTAVPLTPGGLGVLEVGLVGALAALGEATEASLVAGVLLFRFCSFVLPLPLGLAGWLWWTRPGVELNARSGRP